MCETKVGAVCDRPLRIMVIFVVVLGTARWGAK